MRVHLQYGRDGLDVELPARNVTLLEPRYVPTRSGDVPHSLADIGRARQELGYEPAVDLREGLRRTLAYYGIHRESAADLRS